VKQIGENEYEVVMTLQAFGFTPNNIEIPAGAKVTFVLTSKDVVHGFEVAGTNINAMVMPGHIQKITQKFDKPGNYLVLCNEYCGAGHQLMSTTITVK
jgi:cytochrome c oxidase subunit 2